MRGVLPRIGVPSAKKTKKMSEMTAKPQTSALPVGKGPESRKTVPSRKLLGLSHLKLQDTEEGSGYFRWGVLEAAQSSWLLAEPP